MSETPTPALLSTERLAEIEAQLNVPRARNFYVTDYGVAADVVEELFDHQAAYRQQIATELQALREYYNSRDIDGLPILRAARRLGIELPDPTLSPTSQYP